MININLDLNYLKYFYFVVVYNGFTKAAEKLYVQQPVISRAVKLLEQNLGFKLLERQRKQVVLTIEGKEIFKIAEQLFFQSEQIIKYANERIEGVHGDLVFATSDSLSLEIMGPAIKKFNRLNSKTRLIHHAGPANIFLDKISSGLIEFGLFFNVPELTADLIKTKITNVRFSFVVLDKLAKDPATLNSFIASREQGKQESSRLPLFEKYKSHQKSVSIVAVSTSSTARKAMVLNGVGVTILPDFLVKEELKRNILTTIKDGNYSLPIYLVERKSSYRSKAKNDLLNVFKESIDD